MMKCIINYTRMAEKFSGILTGKHPQKMAFAHGRLDCWVNLSLSSRSQHATARERDSSSAVHFTEILSENIVTIPSLHSFAGAMTVTTPCSHWHIARLWNAGRLLDSKERCTEKCKILHILSWISEMTNCSKERDPFMQINCINK